MNDIVQQLLQLDTWLNALPNGAGTIIICLAFGYLLKWLPSVNNRWIPVSVILAGALVYSLLAERGDLPLRVFLVKSIGFGLVAGVLAWLAHNLLLKRIEGKLFGEKQP